MSAFAAIALAPAARRLEQALGELDLSLPASVLAEQLISVITEDNSASIPEGRLRLSRISVDILSPYSLAEMSLSAIEHEYTEGGAIAGSLHLDEVAVSREDAESILLDFGNDGSFFDLMDVAELFGCDDQAGPPSQNNATPLLEEQQRTVLKQITNEWEFPAHTSVGASFGWETILNHRRLLEASRVLFLVHQASDGSLSTQKALMRVLFAADGSVRSVTVTDPTTGTEIGRLPYAVSAIPLITDDPRCGSTSTDRNDLAQADESDRIYQHAQAIRALGAVPSIWSPEDIHDVLIGHIEQMSETDAARFEDDAVLARACRIGFQEIRKDLEDRLAESGNAVLQLIDLDSCLERAETDLVAAKVAEVNNST